MLAAGLLLLLVGVAIPGPATERTFGFRPLATGGPGGGGVTGTVNATINATDAPAFTPSVIHAAPGNLVRFQVTNTGGINHTFTLIQTANATVNRTASPSEVNAFVAKYGVWANLSLAPGAVAWANLTLPANSGGGSYQFLSVLPYQFQAGMSGFLNVSATPTGPPVSLSESTLSTLNFVPNALGVDATGFPVSVHVLVTNLGSVPHTWTLSPLANYNLSASNFTQFFTAHPPLANAQVPGSTGGTAWANFTVPQKGVYEYICTVPAHFASGMFGYLYVGVPVPAPPQVPGTAILQPVVLYAGAGLLGVGILFAVIASLWGRFSTSSSPRRH
jgi:uncharacterized cupredoxin-like copper-binding protein